MPNGAARTARAWVTPGHALALAAAVALGTLLRLYQITRQVVADDEWHALSAAVSQTYGHLLSHFGMADHSIPLAVLDKLALDTWGLSEMVMRMPVLLLGLGSLLLFPYLVRDLVGWRAASTFALLLAVSPLHVYFSRYARPYSASVFFSFVAAIAFYKWWSGAGRHWAHAYALSVGIGTYFHGTVAPVAVAPFAFAVALVGRNGRRPAMRDIALVGLETVLVGTLLLAAPLSVDLAALSSKTATASVDGQTIVGAVQLMAGTRHAWLILALLIAAGCGGAALARTRPSLLLYGVTLALAQVAAVVLLRPPAVRNPIVFARYALPILPWFLLLAAVGMVAVRERTTPPGARATGPWLLAGLAALLLAAGPLPAIYYRPNNWTNHAMFQYVYDPMSAYYRRYRLPPPNINPFYLRLAKEPAATLTLLEAPWHYEWSSNPYPFYQQVHRQWMIVGFVRSEAAGDPAQASTSELSPVHARRFRNFVHVGAHADIAARRVDYVIFHKNLSAELSTTMRQRPSAPVTAWIDEYRTVYGPPVYEDTALAAFAVKQQTSGSDHGSAAEP